MKHASDTPTIDTSYKSILTCLYNNKKIEKIIWLKCSPVSDPPPPPQPPSWGWVMGLSYGEQSLCRVPPSPVHPHEGAPMLFYYNFFIFEAKSLICSLVGAFLWLSRGVASLWCQVCFRSSVVVNLHFSCPNSASVLSSCYSWYQFTWNCLQLEFSENHWFKIRHSHRFVAVVIQFLIPLVNVSSGTNYVWLAESLFTLALSLLIGTSWQSSHK